MHHPLFVGDLCCLCFLMHYFVSFKFFNHLDEEERAGCFVFIVFRMSCYCKCSVALPHGAVGRLWYFQIMLTSLLIDKMNPL